VFSLSVIVFVLSWLVPLLCLFIIVDLKSSPFFVQKRVGRNGKVFHCFKLRSMKKNALQHQIPAQIDDTRITKFGAFLRKYALDELPQFYNVIIGDMSLVGPRPERQFYIDQIAQVEPQFLELTKVRPGITSWGQVKYGYAENVEQMIQRMKYDLLYLRNRSIALDIKIMLYTILIVLKAKGK
jgi:lipopolysaccharide/colanic/teichoic acid biosynthesis glycosyltransferase